MNDAAPHLVASRQVARPRVLLAEDDDDMRSLVADCLREDGCDVVEASDGGRMLVRLARAYSSPDAANPYELVVADIRMPVCTGLQILESLRRASWRTPAILMTAFGDEQTRAHADALGAVIFLKPFDLDDLRTAALHLIARAKDSASSEGPWRLRH